MLQRMLLFVSALGIFLGLVACGKQGTLGVQETQRNDLGPELLGVWTSHCEGKRINRLTFAGQRLTVERVVFLDPECQERQRTTRHSGAFKLAHNYKTGLANSIVFSLDNDIGVTFHIDGEIDDQNSNLSKIQNEKEVEIVAAQPLALRKQTSRDNEMIRAGKQITSWKRDEEKTLSRLQAEKLDASYKISTSPVAEFGSRLSLKYEIDNAFLQISGGSDFARVFSKQ